MATVNVINHKRQNPGTLGRVIKYVSREDKTRYNDRRLVSGRDCTPDTAFFEFMTTKQLHRKTGGVGFYHFVQSFHPDENVTPEQAHEIALKLAEQFAGFEVVVATHVDTEHIHSHLIVNSVSHVSGKKLHQSREDLMECRRVSDEICLAQGLTVLPSPGQKQEQESIHTREYRAALGGDSWKFRLMNAIDFCMSRSRRREDFVAGMKNLGYEIKWTAGRQSITYTCPNGMKCRDKKLHDLKYLKKNMEVEFGLREAQIAEPGRNREDRQALSAGGLCYPGGTVGGHTDPAGGESAPAAGDGRGSGSVRQPAQSEPDVTVDADGVLFTIVEPEQKSPPKTVHERKRGIGQRQDDHSGWQMELTF